MDGDLINGLFEIVGGALLWLNVWTLNRDKKVRGVSVAPVAFFMGWGYWNLYFYPSLGCFWSTVGGVVVVSANTVWVGQMIYYSRKAPKV